ncbi:MAG: grasp-with-spasm system SPASM domain peptide maturase [Chryseobacterium sp.]|nr:MAG: grasp-with-spasm system SPASM domain peptide maturase [Chryseobacterium sp.]
MVINRNLNFHVFAGCKIVSGFRRSIIYDLNRYDYHLIPNGLADLLTDCSGKTINEVCQLYDESEQPALEQYFDFLIKNEIIFFTDVEFANRFPRISEKFVNASHITNCLILDRGAHNWASIIDQLESVLCKSAKVYFIKNHGFDNFCEALKLDSTLVSTEVVVNYDPKFAKSQLDILFEENPLIVKYYIFNSPSDEVYYSNISIATAVYLEREMEMPDMPQRVSLNSFNVEFVQFFEAQEHHLYYNQKMFINENGDIHSEGFSGNPYGNIYNDSVFEIIQTPDFQKLWNRSRDQIHKCRECEFRYMCLFDGQPVKNDFSDEYMLRTECGYNPHNATFILDDNVGNNLAINNIELP